MFGLQRELQGLTTGFVAEHGDIAVERLDAEEASFERLQESLQSSPFLAARKLVIIRSPGANKKFAEQLESILITLPETTDVVLVESKIDKRSSYYKTLKKLTDMRSFPALDEQGLSAWLADTAKEQGGTIDRTSARFLVERVGADQQVLASELNKLLTYDPAITRHTIELLTEPTPQSKIFDLLEAAFAGNTKQALALYQDQRDQKVDPSQIIAMLTWQFKIVAIVESAGSRSDADISREAKLSPYTLQKSRAITRRLKVVRLKELITELLTIDARSKRENIDLDESLQNFLLQLAQ